jgi:hypothetical protein
MSQKINTQQKIEIKGPRFPLPVLKILYVFEAIWLTIL